MRNPKQRRRADRTRRPASKQGKGMTRRRARVREMPWIGVQDMAQALGCCTATVYRYIEAGVIEATRPKTEGGQGHWKISREFALKFLQGVAGHKLIPQIRPKGASRRKRRKGKPKPVFTVLPGQLAFWDAKKPTP